MRLARKFMYVHEDAQDGTIFTAEEVETGDYRISWLDDGHSNFKSTYYDRMSVHTFIVTGQWRIREVFPKKEEGMKYNGKKINSSCNTYQMRATPEGDRYILVGLTGGTVGKEFDFEYTDERIDSYLNAHGWSLVEEEPATSLEPADDIVAANWPFKFSVGVNAVEPEPEFIEPEPDYGVTLAHIRTFISEMSSGGWIVEIDADFYTVRQDGDVYKNRFIAKDEGELAAIFQALRTLDKFVDKG